MKKNNLFLLAFIIFTFICMLVHGFWSYPMWPTIVAAITSASWLFSFADMFYASHKAMSKTVEIYADYPEVSVATLVRIRRAVEARLEQLENYQSCNPLHTKQDEINHYISAQEQVIFLQESFQATQRDIDKLKGSLKRRNLCADWFTVAGFLALLCVITFNPVAEFFIQLQDTMTVGAFAIILSTQYYESNLVEQQNALQKGVKTNFDALEALRKSFESEVTHNIKIESCKGEQA